MTRPRSPQSEFHRLVQYRAEVDASARRLRARVRMAALIVASACLAVLFAWLVLHVATVALHHVAHPAAIQH